MKLDDSRYRWAMVGFLGVISVVLLTTALWPKAVPPTPPTNVVVDPEATLPLPVLETPSGQKFFGGWVKDDDAIAANINPLVTQQFALTPAGQAVRGDEDVFLWRAVRKVANKGPPWYPNVNQKSVGCCVGCGWKHGADVCQAMQIVGGALFEWKPISVESIYGPSRVEAGRGRIRGDGSVGAWAKDAVEKVGTLPMEILPGGYDLSVFSPERARQWGNSGMPDALEPIAREHSIQGCALVRNWTDVKKAIVQGYPVAVCSNQGFQMTRDQDGFCRASGSWAHCMVIIGVRVGPREGGFILNSWGDRAHTGPVWPEDAPVAGFWADSRTIDRMVSQGDSFALADLKGFPARTLPDFIIKKNGDHLNRVFTRVKNPITRDEVFALAP